MRNPGFGRGFLDYLERAADRFPGSNPIVAGAISLRRYNDELERIVYGEGTGGTGYSREKDAA